MPIIKTPLGDDVVVMGSQAQADQLQRTLEARHKFTLKYCASKGWPSSPNELTIDQILQIREQPGWKEPTT